MGIGTLVGAGRRMIIEFRAAVKGGGGGKTEMSDKDLASVADLHQLPELKVLRETYCSQEMTENVIGFLKQDASDLLLELVQEELIDRDAIYRKAFERLEYYVTETASQKVSIPSTRLGRLDLLNEISRRLRKLVGLPEFELLGQPIIDSIGQPFPALPQLKVKAFLAKGVDQKMVDEVSLILHQRRPDILFELSECLRLVQYSQDIKLAFYKCLRQDISDVEIPEGLTPAHGILLEIKRRLHFLRSKGSE